MQYRLEIDDEICLDIKAIEPYSIDGLLIRKGEKYQFEVNSIDKWKDWIISTNANGFNNWLLRDKDKRVPGEKCFKLCGTIGKNETGHFPIGLGTLWPATTAGKLYFFANDSKEQNKEGQFKYYCNNKGQISLRIRRKQ